MEDKRHTVFMKRCLELAGQAAARGHSAVGALIVHEDAVLAEGIEGEDSLPPALAHAEVIALLKAEEMSGKERLRACTLYTTVEPCFMCSYLIRRAGIREVIYGTTTPAGGASSPYPLLSARMAGWGQPPEVLGGVMEEACRILLGGRAGTMPNSGPR